MTTRTATAPQRAGSELVEAPSTEQIRTALVTAVLAGGEGLPEQVVMLIGAVAGNLDFLGCAPG